MPETLLDIQKLVFTYKNAEQTLAEVDFAVNVGEFVALVGRNGSGKTTLTRLAMSLIKPASGKITFQGKNTAAMTPADMARSIGYVFQNPDRQIFHDTVAKEVAYGPQQLGFSPEALNQSVAWALRMTGLTELAGSFPRLLSRGQKQKVAIASAIAMQPKMLILDEPTSGQDPWDGHNLMELLNSLNQQGITIILVTHDMELIAKYATRVAVLDRGHKVFDGTPSELFSGSRDIAAWGLIPPTAVVLGQQLSGVNAQNAAELVKRVMSTIKERSEDYA
ncbi:Energy-coupling factor transporter ATP-binding protein EcfA2 [Sporomusa silvacetica DSM 10669]|uniref:Energy-coupling factor transporter ATP-binding protein EcfA2 n=1 Tax=Sporomusa silvacetica DSM 10669 TaxID=1123289 RepID=A0ABZ3IEX4_9FIRM|nr:ABC transporter ATP-binding protein [Sporomusa silvacetica]OZC22551.1 energy-coupling factor transporter ATP-binding protein EcfA2 [Sporomusa silvacetica DSM 10669]